MAEELTAEAANEKLMARRKALGVNQNTPSTSKRPSEIIESAIGLIVPGECWRHKKPEPCEDCERERQEERELKEKWEQEYQNGLDQAKEQALQERRKDLEKALRQMGIGERHLSCSFENYKGGERVKRVCEEFIESPFDLVLSGGPGTGKTHLAVAIFRYLATEGHIDNGKDWFWYKGNSFRLGDFTGLFISVPELLADIRSTYNDPKKDEQQLIERITSVDYLILDDLGAEKSTEWSISTLYLIIDKRYRAMNPTIVTTNLSIDEIGQGLSRRIASRLSSGKVITIKAPDYRMKRA
jgi:DNA replication protein DnaC